MSDTPDAPDLDLQREPHADKGVAPHQPGRALWITVAVIVVAAAMAVYLFGRRAPTPASVAPEQPAATTSAARAAVPLGGEPQPIVLPPLDESDAVVRELFRQLTTHPGVTAWLATDGLIRNAAVVVSTVADGAAPSKQLTRLRPAQPMAVVERNGHTYLDPRSYQRYDQMAAGADSIDAAGAARLYATLKPRLEEAYAALGRPETTLDQAVERSLVSLLQTPIVDGAIEVEPSRGIGYAFTDPRLESLSGAQKQLLRMGPQNVRTIQRALRAIALALGIPVGRLPAPQM